MVFDTLNVGSTRWMASAILQPLCPDPARRLYFQRIGRLQEKLTRMGLEVMQRASAYVFPTRLYRYLPRRTWKWVDAIEPAVPGPLRVLSYWHVARRQRR